jgi:hypothetical protein
VTIHKLVLYPSNIDRPVAGDKALVAALRTIGLLSAPVCRDPAHGYRTGGRFLQLVTFLGCSPAIALDPPADPAECERACARGSLCHIRLPPARKHLRFRAERGLRAPRCPRCRRTESHWPVMFEQWRADARKNRWECRECGHRGRIYDLDFRNRGAFGRAFVDICGIYPAEAVPGETLLESLREISSCDWKHMYLKD